MRARGDFESSQFRHADIKDQQVGAQFFTKPHRLQPVRGLGDYGIVSGLEQALEPTPDDGVVISQQHAHVLAPALMIRSAH